MANFSYSIYKALMKKLSDSNLNNLTIVTENDGFEPEQEANPWIEAAVIPGGAHSLGKAATDSENYSGIFQVSLYWHKSMNGNPTGTGRIRNELDVIANGFNRGDRLDISQKNKSENLWRKGTYTSTGDEGAFQFVLSDFSNLNAHTDYRYYLTVSGLNTGEFRVRFGQLTDNARVNSNGVFSGVFTTVDSNLSSRLLIGALQPNAGSTISITIEKRLPPYQNSINIGEVVEKGIRFNGGFVIIDLSISYNAYIKRT